jgi:hypothetical protein
MCDSSAHVSSEHFFASRLEFARFVAVTLVETERTRSSAASRLRCVRRRPLLGSLRPTRRRSSSKAARDAWPRRRMRRSRKRSSTSASASRCARLGTSNQRGAVEGLVAKVRGAFFEHRKLQDEADLGDQLTAWGRHRRHEDAFASDGRDSGNEAAGGTRATPAESRSFRKSCRCASRSSSVRRPRPRTRAVDDLHDEQASEALGDVLHDDDLADAVVDRILERGRLLRLYGPSSGPSSARATTYEPNLTTMGVTECPESRPQSFWNAHVTERPRDGDRGTTAATEAAARRRSRGDDAKEAARTRQRSRRDRATEADARWRARGDGGGRARANAGRRGDGRPAVERASPVRPMSPVRPTGDEPLRGPRSGRCSRGRWWSSRSAAATSPAVR